MGNMCVSSSSASHTYSSSSTPPPHQSAGFTSQNGQIIRSVDILPEADRKAFFDNYDPIRSLKLTEDSKLYRSTERQYIKNGKMRGNPNSCATIDDHDRAEPNPRRQYSSQATSYIPVSMVASDLNVPSLNVMYGSGAAAGANGYSNGSRALVEMRLGDILNQGGRVYEDTSSLANSSVCQALIVTLPKRAIPVTVLHR